jgi:hypothetical protein
LDQQLNKTEKRWQQDSWQLHQRIGLRVPLLADNGGIETAQLRVENLAVKRSLYVCYNTLIFGVCDSMILVQFLS